VKFYTSVIYQPLKTRLDDLDWEFDGHGETFGPMLAEIQETSAIYLA
jgi:hypothetical protein